MTFTFTLNTNNIFSLSILLTSLLIISYIMCVRYNAAITEIKRLKQIERLKNDLEKKDDGLTEAINMKDNANKAVTQRLDELVKYHFHLNQKHKEWTETRDKIRNLEKGN